MFSHCRPAVVHFSRIETVPGGPDDNDDSPEGAAAVKKLAIILVIISSASVTAVAGGAVKKWYWTAAQADTVVKAKVKIPFCRAFPASHDCAGGKLIPGKPEGPLPLVDVTCAGAGAAVGGRYRTFTCAFTGLNDLLEGHVQVTVIGKTAFRWRLL